MEPDAGRSSIPWGERASPEVREAALARACCRGEKPAFEELVRLHQGRIFNLALGLLSDRDEAEDAAQETFVRAYVGLKGWKQKGPFAAWLYRIALNVCRDAARRRTRASEVVSALPEEPDEYSAWAEGGSDSAQPRGVESLEKEETKVLVHGALSTLPEHYRATLVLFELEGLSYEEIAELTGAPVGTVRSRLNRARLMFKERVKKCVSLE